MAKNKYTKSLSATLINTIVFIGFLLLIDSYRRSEAIHEIFIAGGVYFAVIYAIQVITCKLEEKGAIVEPETKNKKNT